MDGQYWKGDRTMSTNEWLLTSDSWQFLEPWHGRWYEYELFIASCTDNIYDLENERWLLGDMIDHVGIYGSRVAEGLSAFNVGLVVNWNRYSMHNWAQFRSPFYLSLSELDPRASHMQAYVFNYKWYPMLLWSQRGGIIQNTTAYLFLYMKAGSGLRLSCDTGRKSFMKRIASW